MKYEELKAIIHLEDVYLAQAINYLEAYDLEIGLLINFGAKSLDYQHTVPSLSGTFGIRTRFAFNPKKPSDPSLSTALTEKHCSKIKAFDLMERRQPAYNKVSYVIGQQMVN